jgi:hypothetical protein
MVVLRRAHSMPVCRTSPVITDSCCRRQCKRLLTRCISDSSRAFTVCGQGRRESAVTAAAAACMHARALSGGLRLTRSFTRRFGDTDFEDGEVTTLSLVVTAA